MIDIDKGLDDAPRWLDLPHGVRLQVRPYDMVVWELARYRAADLAGRLIEESTAARELGGKVSGLPDMTDPHARSAVGSALFVVALGQSVIIDWQGVGAGGEPVPVTAEAVSKLLRRPALAQAFLSLYSEAYSISAEAEEGNA